MAMRFAQKRLFRGLVWALVSGTRVSGGRANLPVSRDLARGIGSAGASPSQLAGFTLIELLLVLAVIAMMATIALPQLMPAILMSQHEGASRHVAGYGRSAMAQAMLLRETIVVKVDLANQEYWSIRRKDKTESIFEEEEKDKSDKDKQAKDGRDNARKQASDSDARNGGFLSLLGYTPSENDGTAWGESATTGADRMRTKFDRFARAQMLVRSRQVKRGGILDEIGPLFGKKFSLEDEEETEEEVMDPLLARTRLPENVKIESVYVAGSSHTKDEVEIEITPLGLLEPVAFYIKSEDESYFTVTWDPITGNVHIEKGKKDVADL
jgi:prepilin-type N-terminal cleavage/methylation domain-containing protein